MDSHIAVTKESPEPVVQCPAHSIIIQLPEKYFVTYGREGIAKVKKDHPAMLPLHPFSTTLSTREMAAWVVLYPFPKPYWVDGIMFGSVNWYRRFHIIHSKICENIDKWKQACNFRSK
jgi:hypothetical protein